jgi:hypothetical protein
MNNNTKSTMRVFVAGILLWVGPMFGQNSDQATEESVTLGVYEVSGT